MTSPGPNLDQLADLDAGLLGPGLLDAEKARALRADPASGAVLEALAATRAALAAAADPPVPASVAARWAAALRAEQAHRGDADERPAPPPATDAVAAQRSRTDNGPVPPRSTGTVAAQRSRADERPVVPPSAGSTAAQRGHTDDRPVRPIAAGGAPAQRQDATGGPTSLRSPAARRGVPGKRPGQRAWRRPAVLVAALLVVLAAAAVLHRSGPPGTVAEPALVTQSLSSVGVRDAGPFADDTRRTACLRALAPAGIAPTAPLIGGRQVIIAGRPGVLLVLGTGRLGVLAVVVVDRGCTTLLATDRIEG